MAKNEEGSIKFRCDWIKDKLIPASELKTINLWRKKLFGLGLIGCYDNGIGFGNISVRLGKINNFLITGTGTGKYKTLNGRHYTKVIDYDIKSNSLTCRGSVKASSESLTHAIIYQLDKSVNAVIHIHNLGLWKRLLGKAPTTSKEIEYGTPEMALEIAKLFKDGDAKEKRIIVMGGHKEGLVFFGKDLDAAGGIILQNL